MNAPVYMYACMHTYFTHASIYIVCSYVPRCKALKQMASRFMAWNLQSRQGQCNPRELHWPDGPSLNTIPVGYWSRLTPAVSPASLTTISATFITLWRWGNVHIHVTSIISHVTFPLVTSHFRSRLCLFIILLPRGPLKNTGNWFHVNDTKNSCSPCMIGSLFPAKWTH